MNKKFSKCSQAQQDRFALEIIGHKGTYLEVGAHLPKKRSNTYNLECVFGWEGLSIELDYKKYHTAWKDCKERTNPIVWDDATLLDYKNLCKNYGLQNKINYLSIDIEPPENTFAALKKIINDGLSFDIITFEHDLYQSMHNYHDIACDFLIPKGYKVAVFDVYHKKESKIFETWFVSKDINFKKVSYSNWLQNRNQTI